ncbi:hypothetical protein M7I_0380 [Glarea lozoyensis 74030]|uniref:Uncharacterized protein n=1 Tax=Glarea lozoyensis (strain ATCC 74030 / MF5533) TaxID=1104152 RepID=H0ED78_GLAL7|nr:hypothetical protein M7I_0380 [Glarea lozoyensis 74030]
MSRVTRSRKIDIAEDVSEVSDEAIPRNIISTSVPSHIKQLKAAYRNAIGTKKNKKARSKKKDGEDTHRDVSTESSIVVNNENHFQGGDAPEFSLPVPAQDTGLMALLDTLTMENAVTSNGIDEAERRAVNPTTSRVTRRQLAQQKAVSHEELVAQAVRSDEEDISSSRILSGPKTIKSTKAPTKSNFELPGEALSRKKKEAHEARLKAREEEERKRREFKAKPVRKSLVPDYIPRETAASRARQSRIGIENINELAVSKRNSTIGAHHPSIQQLNLANCSAPRAPGPKPTRKPSTTSGPSMSGLAVQRTVSDKEVHLQRQRAREIYNRDARLTEEMEREKQEREAAAKRAREAAAERGRQASREWAERQRVRKLAEGDRGLGAGYGPGGQMGLK